MSSEDEIKEYDSDWCSSFPYKASRRIAKLEKQLAVWEDGKEWLNRKAVEAVKTEAVQQERKCVVAILWRMVGSEVIEIVEAVQEIK